MGNVTTVCTGKRAGGDGGGSATAEASLTETMEITAQKERRDKFNCHQGGAGAVSVADLAGGPGPRPGLGPGPGTGGLCSPRTETQVQKTKVHRTI